MSNITTLEEINQLLPDNNNGAITEANLRKCFEKTFTELDRKADGGAIGNMQSLIQHRASVDASNIEADKFYEAIKPFIPTSSGGASSSVASSNVASSHLTSTNGAGLTLGANWFIDTVGFYYSIKGLSDKSADNSFDRFLIQDADGKVENFLLNKLFSRAYDLENKVSDKAFNGYLMYNPTTKQIGFSDTAKVSTTFNVPATINVTVKNTLSSINVTAPANNQYSQDIKNTIEKIKQLEDIGFTPVLASEMVIRTLDRSRFPQALITKNYQLPMPFTLSDGMIVGARSNAFPAEFRNNVYMSTREGEALYSVGINKELPTDRNWIFKFRTYNSPSLFRIDRTFGAIHFADSLDASPKSDLANDLVIKDAWSREAVSLNSRISSQTVINETDGFADIYLIKEGGLITLFALMKNTGGMQMTTFTAQSTDKYIHFVTLFSSLSIADFVIKDISYNIQ
jgi:hypothetical protein|nr:MAG TPA: hypothetical protein [Caudoviricetes sp.]